MRGWVCHHFFPVRAAVAGSSWAVVRGLSQVLYSVAWLFRAVVQVAAWSVVVMVSSLRDSPSRARPWVVRGRRVRSRTVSRRTWVRQRWILVVGQVVVMAFRAPGAPSVVATWGGGMGPSSA